MLTILMNILWLFFGGWASAIGWFTATAVMYISIVGIPWARAAFNIGLLTLWPFGARVRERSEKDIGTSSLGCVGNLVWLIFAGWWLALMHAALSIFFLVTIIGIPFALQHWKLVGISLAPIGKKVDFKI